MQVNPYLSFDGQCEAAFKFYEQCLNGKINAVMRYGESPMADQMPAAWQSKVIHACLTVGDMELMGSDAMPEYFEKPQGFSVNLQLEDTTEAERLFDALAAGGTVQMQLQETFWAKRFGMVRDQFGTPWMINCI